MNHNTNRGGYFNKQKYPNKKYVIGASICLVLLIVIGATYAYWTTTKVQTDKNTITTTCINVEYETLSEGITLEKTFPISDADGKATTGYKFKLTNKCDSYVSYNVNLESLSEIAETQRIKSEYLDTILNDGAVVGLTTYKPTTTLITDKTYETRQLESGTLGPKDGGNDSIEYTLRMWLDEDTPESEMNKSYKSKISVYGTVVAPENAVEKITKLAESTPVAASTDNTTQLAVDDTEDQNIRYIGSDPDNYVDIGNGVYQTDIWIGYNSGDIYGGSSYTVEYQSYEECSENTKYNKQCTKLHSKGDPILWRIIGVMNDGYTINSDNKPRLKIIRDEDIGMMAWNARCQIEDESDSCSSDYDYKNNWQNASLNQTLNKAFWNRGITDIRNRVYKYTTENSFKEYWYKLNFEDTGMREISRKLFDKAKWNLGEPNTSNSSDANYYNKLTAKGFYEVERGNNVYQGNLESIETMVGLMYPSDYGYATSGGNESTDREACLQTVLNSYDSDSGCYKNDWLYDPSDYQWTITPSNDTDAINVFDSGYVDNGSVDGYDYRVRPVLYLKSDVKIVSGTGTKENPYKLAL